MFCPKCGNEIKDGDVFCSVCGNRVASGSGEGSFATTNENKEKEKIGINYVDTIRSAVSNNADYYERKFRQIESGNGGKASWTGLIFPFWAMYRKMYKEAFTVLGINVGLTVAQYAWILFAISRFDFELMCFSAVFAVLQIILVIYLIARANALYYNKICRCIQQCGMTGKSSENKEKNNQVLRLYQCTGVSIKSVVWYSIIVTVVSIFLVLYGACMTVLMGNLLIFIQANLQK